MNRADRVRAALAKAPTNCVSFLPRGRHGNLRLTVAVSLLEPAKLCVRIDDEAAKTMTVDHFIGWMDSDIEVIPATERGKWLDRMQNAAHDAAVTAAYWQKTGPIVRRSA